MLQTKTGAGGEMTIRVDTSNPSDPLHPITIWWTNHEWSDLTIEEARALYEALRVAVLDRSSLRLSQSQIEAIQEDVRA